MKNVIRISEEHKDVTCENCGWSWDIEPKDKHPYLCHQCGHTNKKVQKKVQNENLKYLLQMGRKSILVEQYGDEAELFKLSSAYYRKNGKAMTIKVLEKILHTLSKRDEPHRAKSKEFPPSLHLQEQVVQGNAGDPYEYKKEGGYYYARKKGTKDWILTRGNIASAVSKKFTSPKVNISSPKPYTMKTDDSVRYQRDTFDPYAQQTINQKKMGDFRAQQFSKGIVPVKKDSNIPVHIRLFLDFLRIRKNHINTSDFTNQELKTILDIIKLNKVGKESKNVNFSAGVDWSKVTSGEASQLNPGIIDAIAFTLGNAQVKDMGSYYSINDIYDFNNYYKEPEKYSLKNLPNTVGAAFKKIFLGNEVQGVEELASYYQKLGYKGIPVKIDIPKNLS